MAFYLVRARLWMERGEFRRLRPFGLALTASLENARWDPETDEAVWEEEDYCSPPLAISNRDG
ncbi:hypothetical protein [Thermoflexus sp.]|uniref:hypothetical protein n=1 Tax=Thermoflexus sp. TaxID=1969742 RepID=UPI0035E42D50